ncbi:OTU domain-containing protein 5-like [Ptychodera flava]|uniref:OTU domain-containing protein 5-like n=1 Tax=Ptychodera flava TaxID=63121 RepID=UPI00396A4F2A
MTILPKKKASKEKSDPDVAENRAHSHGSSHSQSDPRTRAGRNSPPRWPLSSSREEGLSPHESRNNYERHENIEGSSGGTSHKRRHRASSSPLRGGRKHRDIDVDLAASASCSNDSEYETGCNSGDEHDTVFYPGPGQDIEEMEKRFEKALEEKRGFIIKKMVPDGACLFRAVADQVYGDQEMHSIVRNHCMDYMVKNADHFSQYVTEDFSAYINRKRSDNCHGNHPEMQALSEMYNRPIEVYSYSLEPMNTFHGNHRTDNEPIRVSYHGNVHYNSVVDPFKATIGVGLGLPSFVPGLAEKNQMRDAAKMSEAWHLEEAMLEDKLKATDWEATNEAIEEQIARESYLQWLRDNEKRARKEETSSCSASATCVSDGATSSNWWDSVSTSEENSQQQQQQQQQQQRHSRTSNHSSPPQSPIQRDASEQRQLSPLHTSVSSPGPVVTENSMIPSLSSPTSVSPAGSPRGACAAASPRPSTAANAVSALESIQQQQECSSFVTEQLSPAHFGLSEWDDDDAILASVLAASQQEYFDSLKKSAGGRDSNSPGPSTS